MISKGIDYSINENMKKIEQFLELDIDFNKNEQNNNDTNLNTNNQINNNNKVIDNKTEDDLFSDISDTSGSDSLLSLSNINNIGKNKKDDDLEISEDDDDREWWKI